MRIRTLFWFTFVVQISALAFKDTVVQGLEFKDFSVQENYQTFEKVEIGIALPSTLANQIQTFVRSEGKQGLNPFISTDIRIQFHFVHEHDSIASVVRDAFYMREFERDVSRFEELYRLPSPSTGHASHWKRFEEKYTLLGGKWIPKTTAFPFRVRFAPPFAGKWKIKATLTVKGIPKRIELFAIDVVESNNLGYVKVDKHQRFLKQGDKSLHVIGENFPAPIQFGYPLFSPDGNKIISQPQYHRELPPIAVYEQYLRYMDTLSLQGMNYFRMLMTPWSLDIEYENLGNYYDRLHIAHELDEIVARAKKNNLLINWNLAIHFPFQYTPYHITFWDWTSETGGPGYCYKNELDLPNVLSFFTDERAQFYWKQRLRYIVARWGYSTQIAMFEQFSEIDQLGGGGSGNNDTTGYDSNESVIASWHKTMNQYLKNELHVPQLLSVSYTSRYDETKDSSWYDPNLDVINYNNYNYHQEHIHEFFRRRIPRDITNKGTYLNRGNFNKPMFYSEIGPHEVWGCDNEVEQRRLIWQTQFYGIAGGLPWNPMKDTVIYHAIRTFKDMLDLETGQWHSGMVKLNSRGGWVYKERFVRSMVREDETADLIYMRSKEKDRAMGVITNRRYNYYTKGKGACVNDYPMPEHSQGNEFATERLRNYGSTKPGKGQNRLKVRGMKTTTYRITYYNANAPDVPIHTETTRGRQLTLNFPKLGEENDDILLFKIEEE